MSKKTKRLEKENHNLTRKHDLTSHNILQMAEERQKASREIEALRKRNEKLETLCRGMQMQGRGRVPDVAQVVGNGKDGVAQPPRAIQTQPIAPQEDSEERTESEYEYEEDDDDGDDDDGEDDEDEEEEESEYESPSLQSVSEEARTAQRQQQQQARSQQQPPPPNPTQDRNAMPPPPPPALPKTAQTKENTRPKVNGVNGSKH